MMRMILSLARSDWLIGITSLSSSGSSVEYMNGDSRVPRRIGKMEIRYKMMEHEQHQHLTHYHSTQQYPHPHPHPHPHQHQHQHQHQHSHQHQPQQPTSQQFFSSDCLPQVAASQPAAASSQNVAKKKKKAR